MSQLEALMRLLPDGPNSYPNCRAKVSVVRRALSPELIERILPRLSSPTAALIRKLPPDSTWVAEAMTQEIFAALADEVGPEQFSQQMHDLLKVLLSSKLYWAVFRMMSTKRVAKLASMSWGRFHEGSTLKIVAQTKRGTDLKMNYPPYLFSEYSVAAFALGVRVALDLGGTPETRTHISEYGSEESIIEVRWR